MNVFISWSGDLSKDLAEAIRTWLPSVIQSIKPFFTPDDIEKGSKWSSHISKQLEESKIGIFCLTKDNLVKPWIMFEAGALSKQVDSSRICPILFEIQPSDLEGPLTQFQSVKFEKMDMLKLLKTLNKASDDSLDDTVLENVFNKWWPDLEDSVKNIFLKHNEQTSSNVREDREILEEILELSRLNSRKDEDTNLQLHLLEQIYSYVMRFERPRNSPRNNIDDGVFIDLLHTLENLKEQLTREMPDLRAVEYFNRLEKPLSYILSKQVNLDSSAQISKLMRSIFM